MQIDSPSEEVLRLQEQLREHRREIRRFLEVLVHDVRSHQRGINTAAELLSHELGNQLSSSAQQVMSQLQGEVGRMNLLLTALSSYSDTLPGAQYSVRTIPLDVPVQFARSELDPIVQQSKAKIAFSSLPEVEGDPVRLASVFRHLISNAIKYRSEAEPRIEIQAKPEPDHWVISVQDNGIGIAPEYWKQLFVPFFRLHGGDVPGAGLGLATCKNIVEAHGGSVWLASKTCEGTTFFFTLPRSSQDD